MELVDSLCIADQLGVLRSIELIAQMLHADSQLPPSPYLSCPKPRHVQRSECQQYSAELAVTLENASPEAVAALDHHLLQNVKSLKLNGVCCSDDRKDEQKYQSCVEILTGEWESSLEQNCQLCGLSGIAWIVEINHMAKIKHHYNYLPQV